MTATRLGTDIIHTVTMEVWCKIGQEGCDRFFCDGCQHRILKFPEIVRKKQ